MPQLTRLFGEAALEKGKFRIVSVDTCTVSCGDIDFSRIEALGEVKFYDVLTPDELASAATDADALLVNKAEVTRGLLEKCPRLKYVGTYSTGYNNIDLAALKERGIICCNVPGYSTNAVCQHVFALLFMFVGRTAKYDGHLRLRQYRQGGGKGGGGLRYEGYSAHQVCSAELPVRACVRRRNF